jgi:serine/threonine-protein kinase
VAQPKRSARDSDRASADGAAPARRDDKAKEKPKSDIIGRTLDDRYRIEERLGVGGVGAVYRATHVTLGRPVAVKLLLEGLDPSFRARFEREAKALAGLRHPNIVSIVDYGVTEDMPYLVMELLEGETLSQRINNRTLKSDEVLEIARQLLRALSFVHEQGLVHRDLKPGNVFAEKLPGGEERIKLLDFGLAKVIEGDGKDEPPVTRAGHAVGTPAYMAPEQVAGDAADARTDCYGVGVLLFQMLCGRVPFVGEPMEQLRSSLVTPAPALSEAKPSLKPRPELEALVARAMCKPRDGRFQSAADMLAALEAVPRPWLLDDPAFADTALADRSGDHPSMAPTLLHAPGSGKPPRVSRHSAKGDAAARPRGVWLLLALSVIAALYYSKFVPASEQVRPVPKKDATSQAEVAAPPPARAQPEPERMVIQPSEVEAAQPAPAPEAAQPSAEPAAPDPAAEPAQDTVAVAPEPATPEEQKQEQPPATAEPDTVPAPPPAPAPAATAQSAAPARPPRPYARNPWARGTPPPLVQVRHAVNNGDQLGERTIIALRKYNRLYAEDVRGHLVLARLYLNRNWRPDALSQYQIAVQLDMSARGAPEMLPDVLKMVAQGKVAGEASRFVRQTWGTEALPAIGRAMAASAKDKDAQARLKALRASISGA